MKSCYAGFVFIERITHVYGSVQYGACLYVNRIQSGCAW